MKQVGTGRAESKFIVFNYPQEKASGLNMHDLNKKIEHSNYNKVNL